MVLGVSPAQKQISLENLFSSLTIIFFRRLCFLGSLVLGFRSKISCTTGIRTSRHFQIINQPVKEKQGWPMDSASTNCSPMARTAHTIPEAPSRYAGFINNLLLLSTKQYTWRPTVVQFSFFDRMNEKQIQKIGHVHQEFPSSGWTSAPRALRCAHFVFFLLFPLNLRLRAALL